MNKNILVVDDEDIQANIIADILQKEHYTVEKAYSAEEAMRIAVKTDFSVVLVDLKMPGMGGLGLLSTLKERGSGSNIIIMTAYGTIETAVEAMKKGAFDYITKPFSKDELLLNIARAVESYNLYRQNVQLKEELKFLSADRKLVGSSGQMQKVYELIDKVAAGGSVNVLITGESGTGKELIAREIHARSPRSDMPFIAVNCSAIPETLLESELFGYEKGAFTGAVSRRDGTFKRANGGSIFLDEIADMPLSMQAKLLRVIQDREVTPIGGGEAVKVDVWIISATNRNIEDTVKKNTFREDLYYRLNVVPIHVPPLRERKEDIPELVDFIVKKLNEKLKRNVTSLPNSVISRIMEYSFPGNVRELENMLERAFILAGDGAPSLEHFPMFHVQRNGVDLEKPVSLKLISSQARKLAEAEAIEEALRETNWNRVRASKLLGIDYKTLRKKIAEFDIQPRYSSGERKKS